MRRKLVKQGPATITVSIPKDWIERFNLKPGNEVELEEVGTRVIISSVEDKGESKTIAYNLGNKAESTLFLHEIIVSMYKAGLRDVVIENLNPKQLKLVKETVSNCIGFEIISQDKEKIRITDLGKSDEDSLIKAEEQVYWKLLSMVDQILDRKSTAADIRVTDAEINKLAFFIQRNLATKFSIASTNFLRYEKIVVLECLGDSLRSYKIYTKHEKTDEAFIKNISQIIELLRKNKKETEHFNQIKQKINEIHAHIERNKKKNEASVLASILILKNLEQIYETVLALNLDGMKRE